jgi:hypothetical protein
MPPRAGAPQRVAYVVRHVVGGFFLFTAGVNTGMVLADPSSYEAFADSAALDVVRRQWDQVVMADPTFWLLALAVGEAVIGTLLLLGGRYARAGWIGVIVFHLLLMGFGPGIWLYCLPVLALLVPAAHADWPQLARHGRI